MKGNILCQAQQDLVAFVNAPANLSMPSNCPLSTSPSVFLLLRWRNSKAGRKASWEGMGIPDEWKPVSPPGKMLLEKFLNETFSQSKYVKEIGGEERPFSRNIISADNLCAATGFRADQAKGQGQESKEQRGFWKEWLNSTVQARISILAEVFIDNTTLASCVGIKTVSTGAVLLLLS